MPIPNLIHPVDITVRKIAVSTTFFDDDFREAVKQSNRPVDVTLKGQAAWSIKDDLRASLSGLEKEATGYVVFRQVDLDAKSLVIAINDQIIKIGTILTDVYVLGQQPIGHYEDQLGHTMFRVFFGDKNPSRQTAGG